jgi:hypothetical protein
MNEVTRQIPGYSYGEPAVARSPVTLEQLQNLKVSAGFTAEDEHYLRLAGPVLAEQVERIAKHWRANIIAGIPHLARHSRNLDGSPNPDYLARSNRRFEQWILDTCLRPYDQEWLDYQQEIALRHTSIRKNQTDGVRSTAYVPYGDIVAFVAVMNETMKDYLAAKGHGSDEVIRMHRAWCKSLHLQMALWAKAYMDTGEASRDF